MNLWFTQAFLALMEIYYDISIVVENFDTVVYYFQSLYIINYSKCCLTYTLYSDLL